jgi:hypothetical protein
MRLRDVTKDWARWDLHPSHLTGMKTWAVQPAMVPQKSLQAVPFPRAISMCP